MSVEESEVNALRRLGLTEYESRAYIVLGRTGPKKASEVSFFGGIPRTKTYGAIKELDRKGLIRIIPGKPEMYEARPPNEVLVPLIRKLSADLTNTESIVQALALSYETSRFTKREVPSEAAGFWQFQGRPMVSAKVKHMLEEAKQSIYLATTGNGLIRAYKAVSELLEQAAQRNVALRLIAPVTQENATVAREFNEVVEIRRLDTSPAAEFLTVDAKEMMFVEPKPDDLKTDRGSDVGVATNNSVIVQFSRELLDRLWITLPPLESEKDSDRRKKS